MLPYLVLPLAYNVTRPLMDYRKTIEPGIVVFAAAGTLSQWERKDPDARLRSRIRAEEKEFATP